MILFLMGKEKQLEIGVVPWHEIRKQGIYDLEKLYSALKTEIKKMGYSFREKGITDKTDPGAREHKIEWSAERDVDSYVRFIIDIEFWIWRGVNVIVEEDGKRRKMQKGDFALRIKSKFKKNWNKSFEDSGFQEFLRQVYERHLVKQRLMNYEEKLWNETYRLIDLIRETLELPKRK